jgi:hypothetical protein
MIESIAIKHQKNSLVISNISHHKINEKSIRKYQTSANKVQADNSRKGYTLLTLLLQ